MTKTPTKKTSSSKKPPISKKRDVRRLVDHPQRPPTLEKQCWNKIETELKDAPPNLYGFALATQRTVVNHICDKELQKCIRDGQSSETVNGMRTLRDALVEAERGLEERFEIGAIFAGEHYEF